MSIAIWTISAMLAPLAVVYGAIRLFDLKISESGRNAPIDGTRGFLALAVVAHHFMVSTAFAETGVWKEPDSVFFRNAGPCAVTIFFMITAYLFYGKMLRGAKGQRKWGRFYLERVARLAPMYIVAVVLVVVTAFAFTGSVIVSQAELAKSIFSWLAFTLPGSLPINGFQDTKLIIASVTWSLRYEWAFYFCLPLVALGVNMIHSQRGRMAALTALVILAYTLPARGVFGFQANFIAPFAFGMMAVEVSQSRRLQNFAQQGGASATLLVLLLATLLLPLQIYSLPQVLILAVAFLLICSGTTLFGGLTLPTSRILGEATYGIYLLHGIALFWVFRGGVLPTSWEMLPAITASVTAVSLVGYYAIEKPAIQAAKERKVIAVMDAAP